MNQRQILINRALNSIQLLRHQLINTNQLELYNDLLILKIIISELPKKILRNLLKQLKPHNHPNKQNNKISSKIFNNDRILRILSEAERPSILLSDFLICAGYKKITCKSQ